MDCGKIRQAHQRHSVASDRKLTGPRREMTAARGTSVVISENLTWWSYLAVPLWFLLLSLLPFRRCVHVGGLGVGVPHISHFLYWPCSILIVPTANGNIVQNVLTTHHYKPLCVTSVFSVWENVWERHCPASGSNCQCEQWNPRGMIRSSLLIWAVSSYWALCLPVLPYSGSIREVLLKMEKVKYPLWFDEIWVAYKVGVGSNWL